MHNDGDEMNDDLSALWQTQPVSSIDLEAVKQDFNKERNKQRLYMILDLLMFIPAIVVVFSTWEQQTFAMKVLVVALFVSAIPFMIYQLWLRRVAAFAKETQTFNHLEQLIRQTKNNIKIAFITKHSGWPALIIIPVFAYLRFQTGEVSHESFQRIILSIGIAGIIIFVWCVWAHKRQQRFERQLNALQEMANHRP